MSKKLHLDPDWISRINTHKLNNAHGPLLSVQKHEVCNVEHHPMYCNADDCTHFMNEAPMCLYLLSFTAHIDGAVVCGSHISIHMRTWAILCAWMNGAKSA